MAVDNASDLTELDAITQDYYSADKGKAFDNYFNSSWAMHLFLKEKKGLYESTDGGNAFTVPIEYDEVVSMDYARGSSTLARDGNATGKTYTQGIIKNASFVPMHYYASAKIYRVDELENSGKAQRISQQIARIANTDKSLAKTLSEDFHGEYTQDVTKINGTMTCCYDSDPSNDKVGTTGYGGITDDGTMWTGRRVTTARSMSLALLRDMSTTAKMRDGKGGRIDLILCGPEMHDSIKDQLQMQQRFMESKKVVEAGFEGVYFEGKDIVEDDYCPSSGSAYTVIGLNSNYYGFHVLKGDGFDASQWMIETNTASDKFRDVYWDGEVVCAAKKAHIAYTNVT